LLVDECGSAVLSKKETENGVSKRKAKSKKETLCNIHSFINPLFDRMSSGLSIIQVDKLSASWVGDKDKLVLQDINLEVNKVTST